jgi:replication-associated recombination protein RarA
MNLVTGKNHVKNVPEHLKNQHQNTMGGAGHVEKTESKEEYKPWDFNDTLKKFIHSKKKEIDYQTFKKELVENEFTEEMADIFVKGLKIDISKIRKR